MDASVKTWVVKYKDRELELSDEEYTELVGLSWSDAWKAAELAEKYYERQGA